MAFTIATKYFAFVSNSQFIECNSISNQIVFFIKQDLLLPYFLFQ